MIRLILMQSIGSLSYLTWSVVNTEIQAPFRVWMLLRRLRESCWKRVSLLRLVASLFLHEYLLVSSKKSMNRCFGFVKRFTQCLRSYKLVDYSWYNGERKFENRYQGKASRFVLRGKELFFYEIILISTCGRPERPIAISWTTVHCKRRARTSAFTYWKLPLVFPHFFHWFFGVSSDFVSNGRICCKLMPKITMADILFCVVWIVERFRRHFETLLKRSFEWMISQMKLRSLRIVRTCLSYRI